MPGKGDKMSKKTTIYIPDKIEKLINAFGEGSLSGALATITERYDKITREAIPGMSEAEWSCVCDCLNGCGVWLSAGGPDPAAMIWAEVSDSEPDGMEEKWGVDCKELSAKLQALSLVGRIAVWDVAARFWASPNLNKISTHDLLIEAGVRTEGK